jgi:hypothetical protein
MNIFDDSNLLRYSCPDYVKGGLPPATQAAVIPSGDKYLGDSSITPVLFNGFSCFFEQVSKSKVLNSDKL